jgi:hypothetical protein
MSKLYGLPGSSIDGPGAARLIESEGYRKAVAWVRSQEPDANLNGPMPEFWARQYTVTVGGLNSHIAGVQDSPAGIHLNISKVLNFPFRTPGAMIIDGAVLHNLENIIKIERSLEQKPLLQENVRPEDVEGSGSTLLWAIADQWAVVQASAGTTGVSAEQVHQVLSDFLRDQVGQDVTVQSHEKTVYIRSSNGDALILLPDGSGVISMAKGIAVEQREYAKGGHLTSVARAQPDDDGNVLHEVSAAEYDLSWTEDAAGRLISSVHRAFDDRGQQTGYVTSAMQADGVLSSKVYDAQGGLLHEISRQTFDDGTALEIKTEGGVQHMRSVVLRDGGSGQVEASAWSRLPDGPAAAPQGLGNQMYADMAGFVNALRGRDKVSQVLHAARIGIGYQRSQDSGTTATDALGQLNNGTQTLIQIAGVYAGLRALQSRDLKTQIGGAAGLLNSTNTLYAMANPGTAAASGFLTPEHRKFKRPLQARQALVNPTPPLDPGPAHPSIA